MPGFDYLDFTQDVDLHNQVSGEIKNHATLRRGFFSAVFIVGILYLLIAIVYVGKSLSKIQ